MKINSFRSGLFLVVIIPFGGLLILFICYFIYFGFYTLVESVFYANDPTSVSGGIIRNSYTVALLVLYLDLLSTNISDIFKAIIFIGPMTMLIIAAILAFYETQALAIAATVAIVYA